MTTAHLKRRLRRPPRGSQTGFTLIELLLGAILSAIILSALAQALMFFGVQMEHVREEQDVEAEGTLIDITEAVRQAWMVERIAPDTLVIQDSLGGETAFQQVGSTLRVFRPNGAAGSILDGVANVNFQVDTVRRLRDEDPVQNPGVIHDATLPAPSVVRRLDPGERLALAFSPPTIAPSSIQTVSDVDEQVLQASLTGIAMPIALLRQNLKEFCHLHATQPHNPTHQGYPGDRVFVDLHESRGHGDARPYGPVLATLELPASAVPAADHRWIDTTNMTEVIPPDAEGMPGGVAWGWWKLHPEVQLSLPIPPAPALMDISGLAVAVEPGRSYSLVLRVEGWDELLVHTSNATADMSVAQAAPGGGFNAVPFAVDFRLDGLVSYSQTSEHHVPTAVYTTVDLTDGRTLTASSTVANQIAVDNPWMAAIPDDLPSLSFGY